ncbi:galactose oxidase-like domain-containing protein, partial [Streptomyces phaeochromogenes]|uniref:galactose oxidase-like domain-containing protein n=1 Tax=Streptomyces phaeochromogenes TaxID=1923 RepID=UPI003696AE82
NPPVWRGPVAFGSNNLVPGGHVTPLFQQQPGVWAALTVDKYGVMNRVWLDANAPSPTWAGPVAFGSGNLVPGAPVTPLFQERPGIWSALTVNTRMNVVSVDANATPPAWTGPVAFGSDHLAPGALVTPLFQERPGVWSALTVDKGGRANRVWLDANAPSPSWEGPEPFSSGTLVPGAPVSDFFQQQPGVWAALTVDEAGRMNVVSVDANVFPPAWSAPAPFGEPDLVPGAKVTPLFQQQPAVWAALTVDQENSMNVVRVDANQSPPPWEGPLVAGSYQPITLAGADKTLPIYPGLHLVPGGSLFYTGTTWRYEDVVSDPIGTFSFRITGPESGSWLDHQISPAVDFREEGTSVLLPPSSEGRILLLGGARADFAANGDFAGLESGSLPRSAEILDTTTIPPKWTAVPSMNDPRINANAVLLPDGKVFVHGGHGGYKWDSGTQRSNRVEIYDPVANTWSLGATSNQPRTYHSTALLLPDGRVLCAGGVDPTLPEPTTGGALNQKSFEFYSPPYFFNGPRPSIASVTNSAGAANSVHFGGVFSVMTPQAGQIGRVALMRLGAITHHTDSEQRYVALPFEQQASELRVSAPTDTTEAPPGWYMLWIVTHAGLPCQHAQIVRLSAA